MTEQRDRKLYLGGHDCAAVMGLSDTADALNVWRRKTGREADPEQNKAMKRGVELEPVVLSWYANEYNVPIEPCGTLTHAAIPFLSGTPDSVVRNERGEIAFGVEAKTAGSGVAPEFGAPGTEQVPPFYWAQAQHYLAITGATVWDMPVLLGGYRFQFECYRITRDDAFIAAWEKIAAEFWTRYVLTDTAPAGWLPESRGAWAKERWSRETQPVLETDDPGAVAIVERFRAADLAVDLATAEKADAKADLIELIGAAEGIRTPDWLVTYRATKKGDRRLYPSWSREK